MEKPLIIFLWFWSGCLFSSSAWGFRSGRLLAIGLKVTDCAVKRFKILGFMLGGLIASAVWSLQFRACQDIYTLSSKEHEESGEKIVVFQCLNPTAAATATATTIITRKPIGSPKTKQSSFRV